MTTLPAVDWDHLDWSVLDRLRQAFLTGTAADGPYWQNLNDLAHYDLTYAERIGWKWDHVLRELVARGWQPPSGPLLDWGCGSGIAHRRVAAQWPEAVTEINVFDHSLLAQDYATARAHHNFAAIPARSWDRAVTPQTVVISHVLNELSDDDAEDLRAVIATATVVLWVEPGTPDVARELVAWREQLRADFTFVYPCPHQATCGLAAKPDATDWCHHFANPPGEIGADPRWVKFGQRAGIDLRSLPYSALVMDRRPVTSPVPVPGDQQLGRILGRPKVSKPYARFVGCDACGVRRLELPKKVAPQLVKKLDRPTSPRLLTWQQQDGKVIRASTVL